MKTRNMKPIGAIILLLSILSGSLSADAYPYRDFNETRKGRGERGAIIIKPLEELRLIQAVDSVDIRYRENYILGILKRVYDLELDVENNETNTAIQVRKLAYLGEVRDIMEQKLHSFLNSSTYVPPYIQPAYPQGFNYDISKIRTSSTSLSANIYSNQTGRGYYVVLPNGSTMPTATQVKFGSNANGNIVQLKGDMVLFTGDNQLNIQNLNQNAGYVLFFAAEDMRGSLNQRVLSLPFYTSFDTGTSYSDEISLRFTTTTGNSFDGIISTTKAGRGYYVILPASHNMPTPAQIRAGTDSGGYSVQSRGRLELSPGANPFTVTGLSPDTTYRIYLIEDDFFGNPIFNTLNISFTTARNQPSSNFPTLNISSSQVSPDSLDANINVNVAGRGYYVVLPSSSLMPTSSQIRAGQDYYGSLASLRGSINLAAGNNALHISGLNPDTNYLLFFVSEDMYSNNFSNIGRLLFKTSVPYRGNIGQVIKVNIDAIARRTVSLTINASISGRGYYVILPSGNRAPTSSQVKAGTDSYGNLSAIRGNIYLITGNTRLDISGLDPGTDYELYLTAVDYNRNLQSSAIKLPFSTR